MINEVFLIGNLGRDPEISRFRDGRRYARLNLATSESWKDKTTGERKQKSEWHRIMVTNEQIVDYLEKYAKKGSKLFVKGKLQTSKWQDQQGNDRYSTEVVVQGWTHYIKGITSGGGGGPDAGNYEGPGPSGGYDENEGNVPDDEVAADRERRGAPLDKPFDDEIPF